MTQKGLIKIDIKNKAEALVSELIEKAKLNKGDILVVGCSSSEIVGQHIGKCSSLESAEAVFEGIYPVLKEKGIYLVAQCCEHLNRAIIIEKECALSKGLEIVNVVPQPNAGGSFATTVYKNLENPVAVEFIKADAGLDIGQTLIGMHLKHVAVPVRLKEKMLGDAVVTAARTRHKYIGGPRAAYEFEEEVRECP
ncbi:MAG: TIGR01440 family protein [Clostridia bacterium]|nr:TIGR01440 family protein [Clostridia bacterium]MBQ5905081.1 TIGR01440 family protein [Clostridia bacterium]